MTINAEWSARAAGVLALISLAIGLIDAARLGGLESGVAGPVAHYGATGFTLLAIFAVMRLFAAVGLWMRARWGLVLLASATGVELGLSLAGSSWVTLGLMGFVIKGVVFLATIALLLFSRLFALRQFAD